MKNSATLVLISFICIGCSQTQSLQKQELSSQARYLKVLNEKNPTYLDKASIQVSSDNPNELSYYLITNINSSSSGIKGTSMRELTKVNCANKTAVFRVGNQFEVYTQFFAGGEKLFDIPQKEEKAEMKDAISPLSLISAGACQYAGKKFGGKENAMDEMYQNLEKQRNHNKKTK